eukprot:PhM_4_TR10515/c0_g1_i1/m.53314/K14803/PTC2_3; protein phosphatase PTC2/3
MNSSQQLTDDSFARRFSSNNNNNATAAATTASPRVPDDVIECFSEVSAQYISQHRLQVVFEELLVDLCEHKPPQPKQFIAAWLKRRLHTATGNSLASPKFTPSGGRAGAPSLQLEDVLSTPPPTQQQPQSKKTSIDGDDDADPIKSPATTQSSGCPSRQLSVEASAMNALDKTPTSSSDGGGGGGNVRAQRAARKRTVTMIQKGNATIGVPPSRANPGGDSAPTGGPQQQQHQASPEVPAHVVEIPDVTPLLAVGPSREAVRSGAAAAAQAEATAEVRGKIFHVEITAADDDPDKVPGPQDPETGACKCDIGIITKDYRGSDFSSHHCHTSFAECDTCGQHPADRLCMCCLKAFCITHSKAHYRADAQHSLYMTLEYITSNYKKAFYCAACNTYTWAYVDAYEAFGDQMAVTKGTYLSYPSRDKYFHTLEGSRFVATAASMQGWRSGQEDGECLADLGDGRYLFGVFDGHGGGVVARLVSKELPKIVSRKIKEGKTENMSELLREAYIECDQFVGEGTEEGRDGDFNTMGCTAACVLLDTNNNTITCANIGDSRAIAGVANCASGGTGVVDLSCDHKIYNEVEEARIKAAGYSIVDGRVEGMLAVPRAIGDYDFKQCGGRGPEGQAVTCMPDVTTHHLAEDKVEFIVIACDGVWDGVSSQNVTDFVRRKMSVGVSAQNTVALLLDRCCAEEITEDGVGTDNMSVILVCLRQ